MPWFCSCSSVPKYRISPYCCLRLQSSLQKSKAEVFLEHLSFPHRHTTSSPFTFPLACNMDMSWQARSTLKLSTSGNVRDEGLIYVKLQWLGFFYYCQMNVNVTALHLLHTLSLDQSSEQMKRTRKHMVDQYNNVTVQWKHYSFLSNDARSLSSQTSEKYKPRSFIFCTKLFMIKQSYKLKEKTNFC